MNINIQLKNGEKLILPSNTNHFYALPRLLQASTSVELKDSVDYDICTKNGTLLDPTSFKQLIQDYDNSTSARYIQLASKRSEELTAQAVQALTLNDKHLSLVNVCAYIKNKRNDEALDINLLRQTILLIQSASNEGTSDIAIDSLRLLIERIPHQMLHLLSQQIDINTTNHQEIKKTRTKKKKSKEIPTKTSLLSLLLSCCASKLATSRAAAAGLNPERVAKCHAVELRLACLIAPLVSPVFSTKTNKSQETKDNRTLQSLWTYAMKQSKSNLVSIVLGLAQSKENTIAASIALRSLSMAMHTSQFVREAIGSEDLVVKQIVPLLSIPMIKNNRTVTVEILKLISVVGSLPPGDSYLGNNIVVHGLFQCVRDNIPERIVMEFFGQENEEQEEQEEQKVASTSQSRNNNEDGNGSSEGGNANDNGDDDDTNDDAGTIDMSPWLLEEKDFQPPKVKASKRKNSVSDADLIVLPLEPLPSPKEKQATSVQLLRIGTFLLWRALSSFCGAISLTSSDTDFGDDQNDGGNSLTSRSKNIDGDVESGRNNKPIIDLSKFNHSSSDDDMDTLCVLSRALDRSIRACALGALATAASNNVMGDHIANSEDKRHQNRHEKFNVGLPSTSIKHLHQRSWEDYFLDVVQNDKDAQCRLSAVSVLCSLVGASSSSSSSSSSRGRIGSGGNGSDYATDNDASHVIRRIRVAANPRAAHILAKRMLEENEKAHGDSATYRSNNIDASNKSSFTIEREKVCDALSQRCAFVLCEMSLCADALANRHQMYSYATRQICMLDFVTATRGADTLTSLVQNEEYNEQHGHRHHVGHPQHPQSVIAVVQRCTNVLKGMVRSSDILSSDFDVSVRLRLNLLISLHRALYSMLHRTPLVLSGLVSQQQHGNFMLLGTLDMPNRHNSVTLRYYCLNTLWIMCKHTTCANSLIYDGLILRLKNILNNTEEEEILQVHALEILSWLARGLHSGGASRKATEEREHRIGLQIGGFDQNEYDKDQQEKEKNKNITVVAPVGTIGTTDNNDNKQNTKDKKKRVSGSHIIDSFLISVVLSSYNLKKYHFMSTALQSIARRCILVRSKRSVSQKKGIRIMIRLLEQNDMSEFTDSIHEHAAHTLMNLSTETKLQTSICRQGLKTLLMHCGAKTSLPETTEEEIFETRLHNLCSRVISNLQKNSKNRNAIYKMELKVRTLRTQEILNNTPRRPTHSRPPSVLSSPRNRRKKSGAADAAAMTDAGNSNGNSETNAEDDEKLAKIRQNKLEQKNMKKNFNIFYNELMENEEDDESGGTRPKSRLHLKPPKAPKVFNGKDVANPLLIRAMRRPFSAMYSPRTKRPMPQTEFSR